MALPRFKLKNAESFSEAVEILKNENAAVISGGTDLLHGFKDNIYKEYPNVIVNLRSVKDASGIEKTDDGIRIGALTTLHELENSSILKEDYAVLSEAAYNVATPQIRNNSTIGGNICQQPRCWYYRNADGLFDCLRKGGKFCNAQTGHNEIHSIFGSMRVKPTPCLEECPASNRIPKYFSKLRAGDEKEAAKVLIATNPLAAITGRVCPHTCTDQCNRGEVDESVNIRSVERAVGDYMLANWAELTADKKEPNGKKAAIIGSGPAGLAAAFFLAMEGWAPVVYEQMEKAGGMLRYGIPSYRLPDSVLDLQIQRIEETGVEFKYGVKLGEDISICDIRKEYDQIFFGTGAWSPVSIGIEGEDLTVPAMEMLRDIARGEDVSVGETVVVVGGGNVAVDAAISAKRLGAKNVAMVCLEGRDEMPAFEDDINSALSEGVVIDNGWGPTEVISEDGKVTGVKFIKCTSVRNAEGKFAPSYDKDDSKVLPADFVILAVGQKTDLEYLKDLDIAGRVITAAEDTQETPIKGLYAGGDAVTGPASVVKAMAAGRRAAFAITGAVDDGCSCMSTGCKDLSCFSADCLKKSKPGEMALLPESERDILKEDALGYTSDQVLAEVNRCFNCGCVAASPSDIAPAVMALGAVIETTERMIPAEEFFTVNVQSSTVLNKDEIVKAVIIPDQKGRKSGYMKFRQRKSIDFPLVSAAVSLALDGGKVKDARIVMGAVAPVPLRAKEAEEYLAGKELTEETAREAAEIALKDALPLGKNYYKVLVAKAYVRKALLKCAE